MFNVLADSSEGPLPAAIYRELVATQFATLVPAAVIAASFVAFGALISARTGDVLLASITLVGGAAALFRLLVVAIYRRGPSAELQGVQHLCVWERRYAIGTFAFATLLGLFAARTFMLQDPVSHMVATGLIFGFAAGLVARMSVRAWICKPSLLLVTLPAMMACAAKFDLAYLGQAMLLAILLIMGLDTISYLYRATLSQLETKRKLGALASHDALTGLPNRLQLRERLDAELSLIRRGGGLLAVHFLDLDRFKPVNDEFGHPMGDLLLQEVSLRLEGLLRAGDIVARLGGDEFVVVQRGVAHRDVAEMLARRIIRVVRDPYRIGKHDIGIGVSVGIALAPVDGLDAETLIARADKALYLAKSRGRGCFVFCDEATPAEQSALLSGKDQSSSSLSEVKGFSEAVG